jgi:SPP1 gp7 family putative phage head morphogenesis protein
VKDKKFTWHPGNLAFDDEIRQIGLAVNSFLSTHSKPKPGARPRLIRINGLLAHQAANRTDPTKTTGLRNRWAAEMVRRFTALRRLIYRTIVDEDCFGLGPAYKLYRPTVHISFDFPTNQAKIEAFMAWLKKQQDDGILEIISLPRLGQSLGEPWTNMFVKDSYERGVIRAREQLMSAGYGAPGMGDVEALPLLGTPALSGVMANPFHTDRVASLYLRSYEGLKNITHNMDTQISTILAQGMADGDNPIILAKKMNFVISGMGEDLGVTDSLGRFIPAERRAKMLARTEVIRAHSQATLQEAKVWGVAGVTAEVEFVNAGFNVCPECVALQGKTFTIEEAINIIPVHPHCRCAWIIVLKGQPKRIMYGPD